ncbi:MAG TPA: M67 family metallopeptidase [Solirubrobacteraceae bacterium]|jgi:proteasome lid subunit RPN8/RPN11|nr:M67 family metallopeptidase [Solirubrobacteraceae bacterium]
MRISRTLYDEIVAHARSEAPNECCGIVASVDGEAVRVYTARNSAASPLRYLMDGEDQLRIGEEIESNGWDYGAIYHSHTRSAPRPSETDINMAFVPRAGPLWPGTLYIIVGLAAEEPEVRAYRIESETPEEVALSVV